MLTILMLLQLKRNNSKSIFWYFCLLGLFIGIAIGAFNLFTQRYDAYCPMEFGLQCCCFTYYDNKKNRYSKWTNAYISSLQGYVGGIGFFLYGIFQL